MHEYFTKTLLVQILFNPSNYLHNNYQQIPRKIILQPHPNKPVGSGGVDENDKRRPKEQDQEGQRDVHHRQDSTDDAHADEAQEMQVLVLHWQRILSAVPGGSGDGLGW